MLLIPKIIHQTWKTKTIPPPFDCVAQTWRELLPEWDYHLWTDEESREWVFKHYPNYIELYDAYPTNIQRADAIRYLLLEEYGGLYVDIDFECLDEKIETLFENAEFIVGKEPHWHAKRFGKEFIVCNALMASVPHGEFIRYVCNIIINLSGGRKVSNGFDVLNSTGPFMLTDAYNRYAKKTQIHLLEPNDIYPIGQWEVGSGKYKAERHFQRYEGAHK